MPGRNRRRWPGSRSDTRTIWTAQFPAAISALQKAQPHIGELKDYTSYYIGNAYLLNNSPEESLTYLRDFGTRYPDSVFTPTTRPSLMRRRCWQPSVRRRRYKCWRTSPGAASRVNICSARRTCRTDRHAREPKSCGACITGTRRASRLTFAEIDLQKIPEADSLPPVTYAERERRADGLYRGRRWAPAADEYRTMLAIAPASQQSHVNMQLANALMKTGAEPAGQRAACEYS